MSRNGFSGVAASNYFIDTAKAMASIQQSITSAGEMCSNHVKKAEAAGESVYDFTMEKDYVKEYDRSVNELGEAYSSDTVRSEDERYDYICDLYKKYDQEMDDKLRYLISEMETLCKDHFQVPSATPKVEATLEIVKKSLVESSELSNQTTQKVQEFSTDIAIIDNSSNTGMGIQWVVNIGPDGKGM